MFEQLPGKQCKSRDVIPVTRLLTQFCVKPPEISAYYGLTVLIECILKHKVSVVLRVVADESVK